MLIVNPGLQAEGALALRAPRLRLEAPYSYGSAIRDSTEDFHPAPHPWACLLQAYMAIIYRYLPLSLRPTMI